MWPRTRAASVHHGSGTVNERGRSARGAQAPATSQPQQVLPQAEEPLQPRGVRVEQLLHREPVGHRDHQRGEVAQASVPGARQALADRGRVEVAVPVVQRRHPRAQVLVEHHVREDGEEVAERGAVVHEPTVTGHERAHPFPAGRQAARLLDGGEALVMRQRVDHSGHQARLAAEVVPHRVAVRPGLGGHGLDRERLVAAAGEQHARGRHQAPRRRRQPAAGSPP